ncbi:glycosyltransferase [Geotoga petraea]|uniref:glycosyltransferase n=1 Tax=Geotoga petraea TaxID=28234 RepID=UPI0021821F03|nr:glycosyltransferase [Geotoga petraea]
MIHAHTVNIKTFFSLLFNRKKSVKIFSAHIVPNSLRGSLKFSFIWLPIFRIYLKMIYNMSDRVLAVSEETKNELINDLGIKEEKVVIFRNFVRRDMFYTEYSKKESMKNDLRKQYGYSKDDFIIIGSGQIQPRKGIEDFYKLAKEQRNKKFIWVGGMPFKKATEGYEKMNKIINSNLSNLKFTGTIEREKMIDYYRLSDVFFLPSIHETFGLVIIEAAGSGLPIILRDLEVYKKIFSPFYLYGKNNDDFIRIFEKLKNDSIEYSENVEKSYELFRQYDDKKAFEKLKQIYEKELNSKGE